MKNFVLLLFVLMSVACGKTTTYTPNTTNDAPKDVPTDLNVVYTAVESVLLNSQINYAYDSALDKKTITYQYEDQYVLGSGDVVQIPQTLTLSKGWAGVNDSAKIDILKLDNSVLTCLYKSDATQTHYSQNMANTGLKYHFKSCNDNYSSPQTYINSVFSVSLKVLKADDLFYQTDASALIKVYK